MVQRTNIWLLAATVGLATACGNLIDKVEDRIVDEVQDVRDRIQDDSEITDSAVADAEQLGAEAEGAIAIVETDQDTEDVMDELSATGDLDVSEGLVSLAPGADHGFERAGLRDRNVVLVERYDEGRIKHVRIEEDFEDGARDRVTLDIYVLYASDATSDSGDLNDTPPPADGGEHAYVRADITAVTEFRNPPDVDPVDDGELTGFRKWHSAPEEHFLVFDLLHVLPDHERAPYKSMHWVGDFDQQDAGGEFSREVVLQDGSVDLREWAVELTGEDLAIDYSRNAPNGMTSNGSGTYDLQGTRHCRLDDTGEFTLVRNFPTETTTEAYPVTETIVTTKDGLLTDILGTLEMSDGQVLTRSEAREILSPTACDERQGSWTVQIDAITYGGTEISTEVSKEPGTLVLESTRETTAGATLEMDVVRAQGITDIDVVKKNAEGETVAILALQVDPSGHATGTLTRFLEGGEVQIIEVDRDVRGRLHLHRGSGAKQQFRRINRGEL